VILWYPLTALWLYIYSQIGMARAQKRDFIVSHDFKGTITLVESKCAEQTEIIDERLQFNVPDNGVVLYDGELKSGFIDERTYQITQDGSKTQIPENIWPTEAEEKDTTLSEIIIATRPGSFGSMTNESNEKINFITRHIETNKIYSDKYLSRMETNRIKLVHSIVNACK